MVAARIGDFIFIVDGNEKIEVARATDLTTIGSFAGRNEPSSVTFANVVITRELGPKSKVRHVNRDTPWF